MLKFESMPNTSSQIDTQLNKEVSEESVPSTPDLGCHKPSPGNQIHQDTLESPDNGVNTPSLDTPSVSIAPTSLGNNNNTSNVSSLSQQQQPQATASPLVCAKESLPSNNHNTSSHTKQSHDNTNSNNYSSGSNRSYSSYDMSDTRRSGRSSPHGKNTMMMAPPPVSPSALSATDREQEMAGFVKRIKIQQEQNGVCDATTKDESGNHDCPILWYVGVSNIFILSIFYTMCARNCVLCY